MKLFYTPGACSLASHIILREAGYHFEAVRVDLGAGQTEDGVSFKSISPKGYVPALILEDGRLLTENQVILQYLADQQPASGLIPPVGSWERYEVLEWLAFIATELHKGFGPLWNSTLPETVHQGARDRLAQRFDYVEKALSGRDWLSGPRFGVADAYLFTVLNWTHYHHIDLSPWPGLIAFQQRAGERPAVQAALRAEGLLA